MKKILVLGTFLSSLIAPLAWATPVPSSSVVGKFGFDWLKPNKAKCSAITETLAAGFKTCRAAGPDSEGSFTGKKDFFTCKAGSGSEYQIYSTKERCTEELKTMKANGD